MKGKSPFSKLHKWSLFQAMILFLIRNVLRNVQCLIIRIYILILLLLLLYNLCFSEYLLALSLCSNTKMLNTLIQLEKHCLIWKCAFVSAHTEQIEGTDWNKCWYIEFFFFFFKQPHAFTSMDKDYFILLDLKLKSKGYLHL